MTEDGDRRASDPESGPDRRGMVARLTRWVTEAAGVTSVKGFSFRSLFAEVFGTHSADEVEDVFTVGSQLSTPPIADVDATWPKPWIFFRALLGTIFVYLLFDFAWRAFENITLVPGLIITGSFAIPLSTLVFFVEVNVRRNVSIYQVGKLVIIGGILSMIMSLILLEITDAFTLDWLGGSISGLVEEPGKVFALLIVASRVRYRYILNGILFGAAVGAGFAAFESAGYALFAGVVEGDPSLMTTTILLRGLLSPLGHIVWTAMSGGALWKVKGDQLFRFSMLLDWRFLRVLGIATALHMIWNSPLQLPFFGTYLIVGAVGWIVVLGLVAGGLRQIEVEKLEFEGSRLEG